MTHREQIEAFTGDLLKVVDRYRQEFQLPLASAVGALEIIQHNLLRDALNDADEEDE